MDFLLIVTGILLGFSLAFFSYREHPLPHDEILSLWSFSSALTVLIFLWGLWNGYWDLVAPTFGRFGTLFISWVIAYPFYHISFICLLRKSWLWNIVMAVAFAILSTFMEYISVYVVFIGVYSNGWHIGLTFWSYFIPLLLMWGYYKFLVFLKIRSFYCD